MWSGQALAIATGGMLPRGADAVVMVEHAEVVDQQLIVRRPLSAGSNVAYAGTDIGAGETVLLKDLQRDFLTHNIVHVDFQRVSMTEKLEVNVPLHIVGEAPGVKLSGGILEHILRELRVRCLPADIPDGINIDVSALQINQGVKVKDLVLPKGVESLIDGGSLVVNIVAPAEEEVATPATAAPTGAEPCRGRS
jgi:large subunit ribosomal protein L25